jgi:hypothetical protein
MRRLPRTGWFFEDTLYGLFSAFPQLKTLSCAMFVWVDLCTSRAKTKCITDVFNQAHVGAALCYVRLNIIHTWLSRKKEQCGVSFFSRNTNLRSPLLRTTQHNTHMVVSQERAVRRVLLEKHKFVLLEKHKFVLLEKHKFVLLEKHKFEPRSRVNVYSSAAFESNQQHCTSLEFVHLQVRLVSVKCSRHVAIVAGTVIAVGTHEGLFSLQT